MSLAAMIAMTGKSYGYNNIHKGKVSGKKHSENENMKMTDKQVEDFLKKYNYYSDPVLYDDDLDENKPTY